MDTAAAFALDFALLDAPGLLDFEPRECRIGLEEVRYQVALEDGEVRVRLVDCGARSTEEARTLVRWALGSASDDVKGCTAAYARKLQAAIDEGAPLVWL